MKKQTDSPLATNWQVISGAPCAGKTAVVNALQRRGYKIVPEVARAYIEKRIALGESLAQIKSPPLSFERHILEKKLAIEKNLNPNELIFLDRAVPDSIAYYQIESLSPQEAIDQSRKVRYKQIFIFERLDFKKDTVRTETQDLAQRVETLLCQSYSQLGYEIIHVPVMGIEERADFILARV